MYDGGCDATIPLTLLSYDGGGAFSPEKALMLRCVIRHLDYMCVCAVERNRKTVSKFWGKEDTEK